jgi:hypothetical protein
MTDLGLLLPLLEIVFVEFVCHPQFSSCSSGLSCSHSAAQGLNQDTAKPVNWIAAEHIL